MPRLIWTTSPLHMVSPRWGCLSWSSWPLPLVNHPPTWLENQQCCEKRQKLMKNCKNLGPIGDQCRYENDTPTLMPALLKDSESGRKPPENFKLATKWRVRRPQAGVEGHAHLVDYAFPRLAAEPLIPQAPILLGIWRRGSSVQCECRDLFPASSCVPKVSKSGLGRHTIQLQDPVTAPSPSPGSSLSNQEMSLMLSQGK